MPTLVNNPSSSFVGQVVNFTLIATISDLKGSTEPYFVYLFHGFTVLKIIEFITYQQLISGFSFSYTFTNANDYNLVASIATVSATDVPTSFLTNTNAIQSVTKIPTVTNLEVTPIVTKNDAIGLTVTVNSLSNTVPQGFVEIVSDPPLLGVDGIYPLIDGGITFEAIAPNVNNHTITATYLGSDVHLSHSDSESLIIICILSGAKIHTPYGYKLIEDIRAGDIVIDEYGNHVKIINNIKTGSGIKEVVTLKKGSLGYNLPKEDLSITHGHPIKKPIFKGFTKSEYLVEKLVNRHSIYTKQKKILSCYSLITENRVFVLINGIPVCTWAENEFNDFCNDLKNKKTIVLHTLL